MQKLTELIKKNEYLYASAIADIFSVSKPGSENDVNYTKNCKNIKKV